MTGTPALDARLLVADAVGLAPLALPLNDDAAGRRRGAAARAWPCRAARGRRAGGAHRRAQGIPRPRLRAVGGHAGAAAGDRDAGRCRAGADRAGCAGATSSISGTGSGAILLSVLAERRHAIGIGIDIAPGAVRTARENAVRLGLDGRAQFVVGDWLAAIGRADVILANPPYIEAEDDRPARCGCARARSDQWRSAAVRDGLTAIRAIIAESGRVLSRKRRAPDGNRRRTGPGGRGNRREALA